MQASGFLLAFIYLGLALDTGRRRGDPMYSYLIGNQPGPVICHRLKSTGGGAPAVIPAQAGI